MASLLPSECPDLLAAAVARAEAAEHERDEATARLRSVAYEGFDELLGSEHAEMRARVGLLEEALRAARSRLTLALAAMRTAVRHNQVAYAEAWLLAAKEIGWIEAIDAALAGVEPRHGGVVE